MCLFIVNKKEKEIQKKRNIKSRKIDKRKRKMLVSKVFYNTKLNTKNIFNKEILEQTLQTFANNINRLWFKYSKVVNITKHLKT